MMNPAVQYIASVLQPSRRGGQTTFIFTICGNLKIYSFNKKL